MLDRIAIESLGWTFQTESICPFTGKTISIYKIVNEYGFNTGYVWTLEEYAFDSYEITSEIYSSYNNSRQNMLFKIESISDLSQIMKFANIC